MPRSGLMAKLRPSSGTGGDEPLDPTDERSGESGTASVPVERDSDGSEVEHDLPETTEMNRSASGVGFRVVRLLAFGVLPVVAVLLGGTAGYLKWMDSSTLTTDVAETQSVQAAVDGTVAMLSYRPDTVEQTLAAARDRMTGAFRDSYASLTHDVVIPGARQRQISAVATVPAVASLSATANHATVLVFVNQSTIIGNDPPTGTASTVRVTLDKVGDRWLISQFDPI